MLTGDQCLVFFSAVFGQTTPGVRGFIQRQSRGRRGALFDRPPPPCERSRQLLLNWIYGATYAYVSSSKLGYNAWTTLPAPAFSSDCPAMNGTNVSPYLSAAGTFHMPDSFQIISPGKDGVFGPGGSVLPSGGGAALPQPAQDDLTNFSAGILRGY